ncbi:MAG: hypothetical protein AB2L14_34980 [Candidatus Xenobiia bacterium LiM19]
MTAQIHDSFNYRGECYNIASINGNGFFDPEAHGLKPVACVSSCWRGYMATYEVIDGSLCLVALYIGLSFEETKELPLILGKKPREAPLLEYELWNPDRECYEITKEENWYVIVDELRHPVPFSGGLLICRDFVETLYEHMGFHPAYCYREVHELIFDSGKLAGESDRSAEMAEYRAAVEGTSQGPADPGDLKKVEEWVESRFSLSYR